MWTPTASSDCQLWPASAVHLFSCRLLLPSHHSCVAEVPSEHAPPGSRRLMCFIDDLTVPEADAYGTAWPQTLTRSYMHCKTVLLEFTASAGNAIFPGRGVSGRVSDPVTRKALPPYPYSLTCVDVWHGSSWCLTSVQKNAPTPDEAQPPSAR